jgi:hypothetical protein
MSKETRPDPGLPGIEPEHIVIFHCLQCNEYLRVDSNANGLLVYPCPNCCPWVYSADREHEKWKGGWIKITDQKPPNKEALFCEGTIMTVGVWTKKQNWFNVENYAPTHWMPLPDPPKEEK